MKTEELCFCSKRIIDVQNASYAALVHGIVRPMCQHACYQMYLERCALKADLERREWAAREVVNDHLPSEIYAK